MNVFETSQAKQNPEHKATQVQRIDAAVIGSPGFRTLKLKAAETKVFFYFMTSVVPKHVDWIWSGSSWMAAANTLSTLMKRMDRWPLRLPDGQYQE